MTKLTKNKKRLKYGEIVDLLLEGLANNMIEGWRWMPDRCQMPVILGDLIKYVLEVKRKKIEEGRLKNTIKDLERRDVLLIEEKKDKAYVYLQEKGRKKVVEYSLKLILDFKRKKKKWDGRWFIVFFDVPEIQRNKRDYLRKFLKRLGFYPYQQSVYIFPYECGKEMAFIKKMIEGAKYISYIVAEKIEEEEKVKRFFNLP